MRIPGRKIYRAFSELDRFSDEQCARFVRAANRGFWWGSLRWLVWGSCGFAVLTIAIVSIGFLTNRWEQWFDDGVVETVGGLSPWLVTGLLLPLVLLVIRDWLLIRRVRLILSGRGRCSGCGYGLLGLPVDERLNVICPECGANTKVDQSLGELTMDGKGNVRFQPSADSLVVKSFWTARRKKWAIRGGVAAILVFVVLPLGAIGVREIWMRLEAGEARADRERIRKEWQALLEEGQPAGSSANDRDAWPIFEALVSQHDAAFNALMRKDQERNPTGAIPQPDLIYIQPKAPVKSDDVVFNQTENERYRDELKARDLGLVLIEQLRSEGAFQKMSEMAAAPRAMVDLSIDWSEPISQSFSPMLGKCRALLRINAARMHLARQDGDVEEFVRAAEANMALVRIARCGPLMIWQLVATAMQEVTFNQCREYFADGPPKELAGKLLEAMRRQRANTSYGYGIRGDRLAIDDTIAWLFCEPARVRFGVKSQAVKAMIGSKADDTPIWRASLGTYRANLDLARACFSEAESREKQEGWERGAANVDTREFPLVDACVSTFDPVMRAKDHGLLSERSFELVLRIEEFRAEHGSLPKTLAQLEPMNSGANIRDPVSGLAFGYVSQSEFNLQQFPEPLFEEAARRSLERQGYLLLSTGEDRVADFAGDGKVLVLFGEVAWNAIPKGADVLLTPMPKRQK